MDKLSCELARGSLRHVRSAIYLQFAAEQYILRSAREHPRSWPARARTVASFVAKKSGLEAGSFTQKQRRRGMNRGALHHTRFAGDQVCWIAESSQLEPRGRTNVHTSVASVGVSLPSTTCPVVRSRLLSTNE